MMPLHLPVIERLLAAGAEVNTLDSGGRCPITNLIWYHRPLDQAGDVDDDVMIAAIMLIQVIYVV